MKKQFEVHQESSIRKNFELNKDLETYKTQVGELQTQKQDMENEMGNCSVCCF